MIVKMHAAFKEWMSEQSDEIVRIVVERIERVKDGNFGDAKPIAGAKGIFELRVRFGPGYRIYYSRRGREIVILLCGGIKSGQRRDIEKAKKLNEEV
ncbi:MAG: type II toxin-antitoxin system RelE/ParE family toxin [Rickettsiales bacterium]|jgi:putative addiction module killer protein|nr:type II toxin-antitoxin system RelE/ParE family toxin [Rickettsiales bacterium]